MIVFLLIRNKLKRNKTCVLNSLFIQNVIAFSTLVRRSKMFQPKFLVFSVHVLLLIMLSEENCPPYSGYHQANVAHYTWFFLVSVSISNFIIYYRNIFVSQRKVFGEWNICIR